MGEFPGDALDTPLAALFERQAAIHRDRLAARSRRHSLTYAALDHAADRWARQILARRGPAVEPIALLFEPDVPVVVAILAALKAGKIYVALDPDHPHVRHAAILADAGAPLIVCDAAHRDRAAALAGAPRDVLDLDAPDPPAAAPRARAGPVARRGLAGPGTPPEVPLDASPVRGERADGPRRCRAGPRPLPAGLRPRPRFRHHRRAALPLPVRTRPRLANPYVAPGTPVEEAVARTWAEALGLDEVGVQDDFLELGGSSLQAARVVSRIGERFGLAVPVHTLLDAPRVASMTRVIVDHLVERLEPATRARLLAGLGESS